MFRSHVCQVPKARKDMKSADDRPEKGHEIWKWRARPRGETSRTECVAEPTAMSFRAPLAGSTVDVAAAVVSFVTASRSCVNVLFLSFRSTLSP